MIVVHTTEHSVTDDGNTYWQKDYNIPGVEHYHCNILASIPGTTRGVVCYSIDGITGGTAVIEYDGVGTLSIDSLWQGIKEQGDTLIFSLLKCGKG